MDARQLSKPSALLARRSNNLRVRSWRIHAARRPAVAAAVGKQVRIRAATAKQLLQPALTAWRAPRWFAQALLCIAANDASSLSPDRAAHGVHQAPRPAAACSSDTS
jgi:hypothetical protein